MAIRTEDGRERLRRFAASDDANRLSMERQGVMK
jgi:hypothetical protein